MTTPAPLAPPDRQRLAKLLGMLGSEHDGERAAAGALADRFLRERGLTWVDVLSKPQPEKKLPLLGTWRGKCAKLLERRGELRPWEARCVSDLPGFQRLGTKQRYVLDEIAARVLGDDAA